MLTTIGHYSLLSVILINIGALLTFTKPTPGIYLKIQKVSFVNMSLVSLTFGSLLYSSITSDFTLLNILENSHSNQPLLYKICGVWGSHEGSMLLWCWITTTYLFFFMLYNKGLPSWVVIKMFKVFLTLNLFFLGFTAFTSNPFIQLDFLPSEGFELNPILQDPGLAIHPPLIYLGYIGSTVGFCFALVYLANPGIRRWDLYIKKWVLISWIFLTFGITLGSWWAYYELGWGGWWFWDPVENASLMPWILETALLHSLLVINKSPQFKTWTLFLLINVFIFSLLGTFFVRSGFLTSVHSFVNEYSRSLVILVFLVILIIITLSLYLKYIRTQFSYGLYRTNALINVLFINNILLTLICFVILFGTFAPFFIKLLFNYEISLGFPFFNNSLIPITVPLILFMAISTVDAKSLTITKPLLLQASGLSFILILIIKWFTIPVSNTSILGLILAYLLLSSILLRIIKYFRSQNWSMVLSHLGVAFLLFGISISTGFSSETAQVIKPGQQVALGGNYSALFRGINNVNSPTYNSLVGNVLLIKNGHPVANLFPEKRFYFEHGSYSTKASIVSNITSDVYAVLSDGNSKQGWYTKFYYKPGIPLIWTGGVLITGGGCLSLLKTIKRKPLIN